jgi:hypothetical protein
MKPFAAAYALVLAAAAAAAQQPPPVPPPDPGLRQALQEFRTEPVPPPQRQLTEAERAELRRQLNEHARPPARRTSFQEPR